MPLLNCFWLYLMDLRQTMILFDMHQISSRELSLGTTFPNLFCSQLLFCMVYDQGLACYLEIPVSRSINPMYISMLEFITNCFVAHCLFISLCGCLKFDRSWFCYWCVILNKWSLNTWYYITTQSMQIIYVYNKRNILLLLYLWLDFLFNFIN